MKKVFVVTVNYNTAKDTRVFLDSLEKIKVSDFSLDVIVVDNGSKEKFTLNNKKQKYKTSIIRSEINTGFAGGYNIGMKSALGKNADYILVVNNDTIVHPDMIRNLLVVLDSDARTGVSTPKIYFASGHEFHKERYKKEELGKVFWYAGGYTDWANVKSVHRGVDEVDHGQYDTIEKTAFASGCCMLFTKEVLERVGLFDEKYFLYYEDADLNERIKKSGYSIMYVPTAILWHVNAASSGGSGNPLQDYFITRNQMLFGMKYAPLRTKIALIRQSLRLLLFGRSMQKLAIEDYYLRKWGKGRFFKNK